MKKSRHQNFLIVTEPIAHGIYRYISDVEKAARLDYGLNTFLVYSSIRSDQHLEGYLSELKDAGVDCLDLRISNAPNFMDFAAAWKLFLVINKFEPNVIQASCAKAGLLVRALSVLGGIKSGVVLYVPHAYYRTEDLAIGKISFLHWFERWLAPYAFTMNVSWTERMIGVNSLWVDRCNSAVFPNWVDMNRFRPEVRHSKVIKLGTVGRFTEQKNSLALHRALIQLCSEEEHVEFIHVGDGLLKAKCIELWENAGLRNRLHVVDPNPYVERNLAQMDGFVLPSLFEGMPFVVLEAGAVNLPILLSDVSGNSDFKRFNFNSLAWCSTNDVDILRGLRVLMDLIKLNDDSYCNHRDIVGFNFSAAQGLARVFNAINDMVRINSGNVV